jgi:hypothetical protein
LERAAPVFAGRDGKPDLPEELALAEIEFAPLRGDLLGQFLDAVVESGQRDRAIGVVQIGDDAREDADRIDCGAAVKA